MMPSLASAIARLCAECAPNSTYYMCWHIREVYLLDGAGLLKSGCLHVCLCAQWNTHVVSQDIASVMLAAFQELMQEEFGSIKVLSPFP